MLVAAAARSCEHVSLAAEGKAAKLGNMLSLVTTLAALVGVHARRSVAFFCVWATLLIANLASADVGVQAKTRVWDFGQSAPLNACSISPATPGTHREIRSSGRQLAADSLLAAEGAPFRDSAGRLRNADGTFAFDGGPKRVTGGTHGNTAGSQEAVLYERYDADGNFLKHGISQDPAKRYTKPELNGGQLVETQRGSRSEMLKVERDLVETSPDPLNKEPWAGKRKQ